MKHSHTLAAIDAAETRMEISRREIREGLHRVDRAFRETVTRPSTLAAAGGIAGLAGLAGFLLARRPRARVRYTSARYTQAGAGVVVASSLAAVGRFLLSRYGVKGLTLVVRQLRRKWEKRNAASAHSAAASPYYAAASAYSAAAAGDSRSAAAGDSRSAAATKDSRYDTTTGDSYHSAGTAH